MPIFMSVNAIQKFLSYDLILVNMAMASVCQKSICIYQDCGNKEFMFTIKEVCSPENQFFNIIMAVHFLSEKLHLVLISY